MSIQRYIFSGLNTHRLALEDKTQALQKELDDFKEKSGGSDEKIGNTVANEAEI